MIATNWVTVHLGHNDPDHARACLQFAQAAFNEHPNADLVTVIGHGGWRLGYNRDLHCVESANDGAVFPPAVKQWWVDRELNLIASIRRDAPAPALIGV